MLATPSCWNLSVVRLATAPRRQRLSRWRTCLTTGSSLLCSPSLTGCVASRRVRPLPVFSPQQPMQARLLTRWVRSHWKRKTHKDWLSVCRHVPRRVRTKAYGLGFCLRRHSDERSVGQDEMNCKGWYSLHWSILDDLWSKSQHPLSQHPYFTEKKGAPVRPQTPTRELSPRRNQAREIKPGVFMPTIPRNLF